MEDWRQRTRLLLGEEKMGRLQQAHVLVVGLGGVGAYAAEMICRAGVGRMTIVDADTVQPTNINRQLPALHSTLGMSKAEILEKRFRDINPEIELTVLPVFLKDENIPELLDAASYDFVVDAIDTLAPKCYLIAETLKRHIKIVSSMGAGAKSDITQVRFADIWDTYHCGLSKAVRKRLQKMGIKRKLPVVFSTEQADPKAVLLTEDEMNKKSTCGTPGSPAMKRPSAIIWPPGSMRWEPRSIRTKSTTSLQTCRLPKVVKQCPVPFSRVIWIWSVWQNRGLRMIR